MSLSDHPRAYGTAAVAIAFTAGVLVTLGFKDFYPDLERRYQSQRQQNSLNRRRSRRNSASSTLTAASTREARRRSSFFWGPVSLEDHEEEELKDPASVAIATTAVSGTTSAALASRATSVVTGIEGCIGSTPLIEIPSLSALTKRTILAKAEFLNGAGNSPKDRVALNIILTAESQGLLVPYRGDTIFEGTVGSTGISLAALARARGYKAHICMPDDQAREKSDLLHHLGATVERVPLQPITSPEHYVNLARRRAAEHAAVKNDGSVGFFADQFENEANHSTHRLTTGPEIHTQTRGQLSAFVAGAGTGGTISGVAAYLKLEAQIPNLRIVLADPQGSGLYNKIKHGVMYSPTEREGTRRRQQIDSIVEGVGVNRITTNFEVGRDLIDDAVRVTDVQACVMARWLVEHDGIFVGSSSAVNCVAAVVTAMSLPEGSRVVTVLCDSGTRHLSRFWKRIGEMGLEENDADEGTRSEDLFKLLGIESKPPK
ncbi:cysteine synthase-like protein [Xylariaceae sp. FL0255]|nr:cysteine synthase-like protein [Xylariaceae sp. FL0255]